MAEIKDKEQIPEGWKKVRLGEIIRENEKSPFKVEDADNEGRYPFFTSGENVLTHSIYIVDGENLFLSTGGSAYVKFYDGKASYSTDTYSIKSKINCKYLYYFLLKKIHLITFRYFIGSGLEHLQKDDFKNSFFVNVPKSLPEQRKIAEILETVDNAIEKTDKIIEKYKRIKQGLMQDLLTKGIDENGNIRSEKTHKFKDSPLGRIPEEWEVVRLGDVVYSFAGGTPNREMQHYFNGHIKWLKSGEINKKYIYDTEEKITWEGFQCSNAKWIEKNTVVIALYGATAGQVGIIKNKMAMNQAVLALSENKNRLYHEWLYYYLSVFVLKILQQLQGSGQPNLSKIIVDTLSILLPPLPEQHRIASILSQIDETIEKEQKYKEKLERVKRGLMEDLLTGKVRVNHLIEDEKNVS